MEIFFSILCAIFSIITVVFRVRNRIKNSRLGTRRDIRDARARHTDLVSDHQRLERDKERVEELDARDADKLKECSRIGERIRKREQEADITE